jgi:bifunctional ADP-heptose synthase (sugar kinase/adenylyltransferase)
VACNLAALGAGRLHAIGFTGDDGEGFDLRKELTRLGCSVEHLHKANDRYTPTYLKPRDANLPGLEGEHSRYDTKNRSVTGSELEGKVIRSLDALLGEIDAVIVVDQAEQRDCGVVTRGIRAALTVRAGKSQSVLFWADSRRRIREFRGLIIKPNQFETVGIGSPAPGDEVGLAELVEASKELRRENGAPVVITRGPMGMLVSDPDWTLIRGVKIDGAIDPTGAGDSVTAGTVLALCAGGQLPEAALVGNLVASITVQQLATTGVATPEQVRQRLGYWRGQQGKN